MEQQDNDPKEEPSDSAVSTAKKAVAIFIGVGALVQSGQTFAQIIHWLF